MEDKDTSSLIMTQLVFDIHPTEPPQPSKLQASHCAQHTSTHLNTPRLTLARCRFVHDTNRREDGKMVMVNIPMNEPVDVKMTNSGAHAHAAAANGGGGGGSGDDDAGDDRKEPSSSATTFALEYLRSEVPRFSRYQAGEAAGARVQMVLTDAKVCQGMPWYAWVCPSMPGYA